MKAIFNCEPKLEVCFGMGRKHCWKRRKCWLTIFPHCPTIFSKGFLTPFPDKPWFLFVCSTKLLKTLWEKEKLLPTCNFSFFPQCFLPILRTFCHFDQIQNCCLQTLSVWKSLIFVIWKRVKRCH